MSIRNNSAKIFRKPSNTSQNRVSSVNKSQNTESSPKPRSGNSSTALANRLIQKRASTDRKLEVLRQKKLADEMKEVQSKPKILSKSRELARKAEKKIFADDIMIEVADENAVKTKKKSRSQNKIQSCKSKYDKSSLIPNDPPQNRVFSNLKGKIEVKSQKITRSKIVASQRMDFMPSVHCNDTFELEEEMGLLEKRLGLDCKQSLDLKDSSEDKKSFVFSPNPRVNQRLNFKHKFRIREIM